MPSADRGKTVRYRKEIPGMGDQSNITTRPDQNEIPISRSIGRGVAFRIICRRVSELFVVRFLHTRAERNWGNFYKTTGVFPWVTGPIDVEGYFCQASYLAALFKVCLEDADARRAQAAQTVGKAHDVFLEKRKLVVRAVWPNGGSPDAQKMWEDAGGKSPETVKGKKLLSALKVVAKANGKDEKLLDAFTIPEDFELAPDLRAVIEASIENNIHGATEATLRESA